MLGTCQVHRPARRGKRKAHNTLATQYSVRDHYRQPDGLTATNDVGRGSFDDVAESLMGALALSVVG